MRQILVGEELEQHVGSRACPDQEKRRQMGFHTQVQQCFGKGPTSISPRVGRGDEHLYGLGAPLVSLVYLVGLVYLVSLVHLVYPVSLVQPKNQTD
jgi:hypothetical protein